MEIFAESLRELIAQSGLSIRQIAKESKVSGTQYGKYLRGASPTIDVAVRIANYFGCSLDYLFGLTEQRTYPKYVNEGYDLSNFLERYSKLLEHNKITHWKFARQYGLSESNKRHWLYGNKPSLESLLLIAFNLSGSIDALLGRI